LPFRFSFHSPTERYTSKWMRLIARARVVRFLVILLMNRPAGATSIIAQVDSNRILFAADTHGDKLDPGSQAGNENECKIVPLGRAAFAITGNMDYMRHQLDDPVASWDSRVDARDAYTAHDGDLLAAVQDWSGRAKRHYSAFYRANPTRVAQLAKANTQNILLVGIFVGFRNGQAALIMQLVYLDESQVSPILDKQVLLPARNLPYTSNAITQDLIEGHSERTKAGEAAWRKKSESLPASMKESSRLEFFIQETSKYDMAVGTHVNIIEVFPDRNPHWLQNVTCRAE
jgi:hypothetical protein